MMKGTPPTLLIVDDEARILNALRRSLRREGFRLVTAETPDEALKIVDDTPVAAVICDHKMPSMSGDRLLAEIADRQPQAALMLLTGWPEAVPAERLRAIGVHAVMPKPWDDGELKKRLREVLHG